MAEFQSTPDPLVMIREFIPPFATLSVDQMRQVAESPFGKDANVNFPIGMLASAFKFAAARRPYYNVWPAILPHIMRLNMDNVKTGSCRLPINPLMLRFRKGDEPIVNAHAIQSIWMVELPGGVDPENPNNRHIFPVVRLRTPNGGETFVATGMHLHPDLSIQDCVNDNAVTLKEKTKDIPSLVAYCAKLYAILCCIKEDSSLLTPDILERDRQRVINHPESLQNAVRRAHQRGKVGWNLGEAMQRRSESDPHWVGPHYQIYWQRIDKTKHGGALEPVVREKDAYRRNDKKLTEIPTGYLDDEPEQG